MDKDEGYIWAPYIPAQPKELYSDNIKQLGICRDCLLTIDELKEILSEDD